MTSSKKKNPGTHRKKTARQIRIPVKYLLLILFAAVLLLLLFLLPGLILKKAPVHLSACNLSDSVLAFRDDVEYQTELYDIPEFLDVLLAIMMQESGGEYDDLFQCSESPFNTAYEQYPGSITDPYYSIEVGVLTFARCLEEAGCTSPSQTNLLDLSLQNYNYGSEYAAWALENYGGYSEENALEFSWMMADLYGWESFGDPEYVAHVRRYLQ